MIKAWLALILLSFLSATNLYTTQASTDAPKRFNPATDLFIAQFDIKTDVDDLHSVAALATMLQNPILKDVRFLIVAGTYGQQSGDFISAPLLFDKAFGPFWLDAHMNYDNSLKSVVDAVAKTLTLDGDIWVMEAGQSDFTHDWLSHIQKQHPKKSLKTIHIVQHSDWNEQMTSPEALMATKSVADYIRIPDGNKTGNGSPGFQTENNELWSVLLNKSSNGSLWQDARTVANNFNGQGYDNPAIRKGGMDFSDVAEAAYIFGYDHLITVEDFIQTFVVDTR